MAFFMSEINCNRPPPADPAMSTSTQSLTEWIIGWDGQSADDIRRIYQDCHQHQDFLSQLLSSLARDKVQRGASWLLKHYLSRGHVLHAAQTNEIYTVLFRLTDWQTKLHILQAMLYLPISVETAASTAVFLRRHLSDENTFIRAWAYNGFYLLSQQYPAFKTECDKLFAMALEDESAAVKARIRNAKKGKLAP